MEREEEQSEGDYEVAADQLLRLLTQRPGRGGGGGGVQGAAEAGVSCVLEDMLRITGSLAVAPGHADTGQRQS